MEGVLVGGFLYVISELDVIVAKLISRNLLPSAFAGIAKLPYCICEQFGWFVREFFVCFFFSFPPLAHFELL